MLGDGATHGNPALPAPAGRAAAEPAKPRERSRVISAADILAEVEELRRVTMGEIARFDQTAPAGIPQRFTWNTSETPVQIGKNELYVELSSPAGDASAFRGVRVRLLRDDAPIADEMLWSQPGAPVQGAGHARDRRGQVQGMRPVRPQVSGRGDSWQQEGAAHDRRREVHQVRRLR